MVTLDHDLLFVARTMFNASNVQRLKGLILAYEQAVHFHNHQWLSRQVYQTAPENRLRAFVLKECRQKHIDTIEQMISTVSYTLGELAAELRRLDDRSAAIDKTIRDWYKHGLPQGRRRT